MALGQCEYWRFCFHIRREWAMGDWLTWYQVREGLAVREEPIGVNHDQVVAWRDWGLLEQDEAKRWAPNTVAKVVRIHELRKTLDSLARRVIVLNAESFRVVPPPPGREDLGETSEDFFRVPAAQLRRAMIEVAPRISPHLRKAKTLEAAIAAFHRRSSPGPLDRFSALPRGWRPPPREQWVAVLEEAPLDVFANSAGTQYYFAGLLRVFLKDRSKALDGVPFEEQIVLLTVRDLSIWHGYQRETRERLAAEEAARAAAGPSKQG
jgi:hypothetical protein